jgi:hypothetical protein
MQHTPNTQEGEPVGALQRVRKTARQEQLYALANFRNPLDATGALPEAQGQLTKAQNRALAKGASKESVADATQAGYDAAKDHLWGRQA